MALRNPHCCSFHPPKPLITAVVRSHETLRPTNTTAAVSQFQQHDSTTATPTSASEGTNTHTHRWTNVSTKNLRTPTSCRYSCASKACFHPRVLQYDATPQILTQTTKWGHACYASGVPNRCRATRLFPKRARPSPLFRQLRIGSIVVDDGVVTTGSASLEHVLRKTVGLGVHLGHLHRTQRLCHRPKTRRITRIVC